MIDPALLVLLVVVLVAIAFLSLFLFPRRRSKVEATATLLYEERCSGRKKVGYGFFAGGNIPNWRISLYEDFFVIASIGSTRIPYSEVQSVEYARQVISKGVRIRARNPRIDIVLYPKEPNMLMQLFAAKDVPISPSTTPPAGA